MDSHTGTIRGIVRGLTHDPKEGGRSHPHTQSESRRRKDSGRRDGGGSAHNKE